MTLSADELELYDIAYRLHQPLSVVLDMDYTELVGWSYYFSVRPTTYSDDYRAYLLLSAQGVKEKPENIFPSIAIMKQQQSNLSDEEATSRSLRSSGLLTKLINVAKTNNIDWIQDED